MVFGRSLAFSGMLPVSLWDTLIVAAAQLSECRYLLSYDFQEGLNLGNLKLIHPLIQRPEDLSW